MSLEPKVFMIIGKSFSGKDTLMNEILSDKEFCKSNNLEQLVRCTTRKMRPGEVEGKTYYFITDEDYENNYKDRDDVITTSYDSEFGTLYYITDFSKLEPGKNYITVGDTESIESYKKILGRRLCIVYLMPPDWVLFQRFSKRNDNSEYDDLKYKEIHRRYIDDLQKFNTHSNEYLSESNCIVIAGREYDSNMDDIKKFINQFIFTTWFNIGVLFIKNKFIIFSNHYTPTNYNFSFKNSVNNIVLCNGDLTVNINDETYIVNRNRGVLYIKNKDN